MAQLEAQKSALAEHHKMTEGDIAWDDAKIIGTHENWQERRILEAWQINKNDGLILPREYLSVVLKDKRDANLNQVKA